MSKRIAIGLTCAAALLVAGCHKSKPGGQVAATVNGDEITLQELNTEMEASKLPQNIDKQQAQRAVLQRVIDRKLLVGAAHDKKMDKSPEFLSQKLRDDELLLAQTYARQQLAAVPVPTDSDISKFMGDHPAMFGQREQLLLDQIRFQPPKDLKQLQALNNDHSNAAVATHLAAMGIKFDRSQAGLDTASAPQQLIAAINKLPAGEPFVVPYQGLVTVNVVTGRKPVAIDPAQARAAAASQWRQQKFSDLLLQQVAALRSSAKIDYQSGFAPPPITKGAAPGSTPPAQ